MKKRLKWLLVGSLMCIGVGSVFHQGYGMKNGYKPSWKQKALEARISEVELKKVKKKFFTYKQLVIGYEHWNKFNEVKYSEDVTNKEKLTLLINAAENGCEQAIRHLLYAYLNGWYGLQANDREGLVLAQKYADQGSEMAIDYFLYAYKNGWYGLTPNISKALEEAKKYADKGNKVAKDFIKINK